MADLTFGRWLSNLRKNLGMSQQALAQMVGQPYSVRTVNELEQDRLDPRDGSISLLLAQALGIDVAEIVARASDFPQQAEKRKQEREVTRSAMLAFRRERSQT